MTPLRMRTAATLTATALIAAGTTAAFTIPSFAATADETPPAAADPPPADDGNVPDGNSPGTGADAYDPNDPFVDTGEAPKNIPAGTVVALNFKFFPTKLSAKPGQKLTLDNRDIAIHNIQTLKGKVKVKSKDASNGQKVNFKAPKKAGKYVVGCYYHQTMLVTMTVKGAAKKAAP